ncbi:major tail protein [Mycobacterium phage Predator]|uniref:Major tail subunit n=1 Tax=Mycobacterium phage Predator TaxID=543153 RepID=B3VM54_9CAUD|nr:major tail protein [Mycobacterium phage Predator]ACF05124.1 putative major tail subunit [Mycobacterium phage Predator]
MSAPVADALPYGVRDCKLTEYIDAAGNVLGSTSVDLPYMQTLSFSESEEFQELRGDDKLITTRGQGAQVDWDLEAGGMSTPVWAILTGGDVVESGLTPNRVIELRKKATQSRPFFRIDGKIISDSGGDILVRIYRCRCNDTIDADFSDGEFMTTAVSGVGLPLLDDTNDLLYSIFRRETSAALTLTPDPNPVQSPLNLTAGSVTGTSPSASVALTWTPVAGATAYVVEKSTDAGATWESAITNPTSANATPTGLSSGSVKFRVSAIVGGVTSDPCPPITVTIP